MVELTRFVQISKAEMLANLLKSEGIDCYVRDSFITQIYGQAVDFGGVKVELLEKDLQRATEIMNNYGYLANDIQTTGIGDNGNSESHGKDKLLGESEYPDEEEQIDENEQPDEMTELDPVEFQQNKTKSSMIMTVYTIAIIILVISIIILKKYFFQH